MYHESDAGSLCLKEGTKQSAYIRLCSVSTNNLMYFISIDYVNINNEASVDVDAFDDNSETFCRPAQWID